MAGTGRRTGGVGVGVGVCRDRGGRQHGHTGRAIARGRAAAATREGTRIDLPDALAKNALRSLFNERPPLHLRCAPPPLTHPRRAEGGAGGIPGGGQNPSVKGHAIGHLAELWRHEGATTQAILYCAAAAVKEPRAPMGSGGNAWGIRGVCADLCVRTRARGHVLCVCAWRAAVCESAVRVWECFV